MTLFKSDRRFFEGHGATHCNFAALGHGQRIELSVDGTSPDGHLKTKSECDSEAEAMAWPPTWARSILIPCILQAESMCHMYFPISVRRGSCAVSACPLDAGMCGAHLATLTVVPQIEVGASANLQPFAFRVLYRAFKHFAAKVFAVAVLPNQPNAACLRA